MYIEKIKKSLNHMTTFKIVSDTLLSYGNFNIQIFLILKRGSNYFRSSLQRLILNSVVEIIQVASFKAVSPQLPKVKKDRIPYRFVGIRKYLQARYYTLKDILPRRSCESLRIMPKIASISISPLNLLLQTTRKTPRKTSEQKYS